MSLDGTLGRGLDAGPVISLSVKGLSAASTRVTGPA